MQFITKSLSVAVAALALAANLSGVSAAAAVTHTGDLTFYELGLGACGNVNYDYEWVAAIGTDFYQTFMVDGNPNHATACGKTASVTYGGKTITVGIVDRCEGCAYYDLDLSPSAFQQFAALGAGRLHGATWHFNA